MVSFLITPSLIPSF